MLSIPGKRVSITAFVVCCNEEEKIERCLKSLTWCDEIVVVDSGSTDATLSIVERYTKSIYHRDWTGYVDQKAYALSLCSSIWILNLDADEEVSPELRESIIAALENDDGTINGYLINRAVHYLDRWWRKGGWYPEYRLRLCRRVETVWGGEDPHDKASVRGPTAKLTGELFHYTYSGLADHARRVNALSSNAAHVLHRKNASVSWVDIVGRPIVRFFKFYVAKRGFREGIAGFIVAWLEATQVLLKYAKLWEKREISPPTTRNEPG